MTPEIVIALLAIAKVGGIILPLFSGFGAGAVAARLVDANARLLFTADGFFRRGKPVALKPDRRRSRRPGSQPGTYHRSAAHRPSSLFAARAGSLVARAWFTPNPPRQTPKSWTPKIS